jgi:hypothetical protein
VGLGSLAAAYPLGVCQLDSKMFHLILLGPGLEPVVIIHVIKSFYGGEGG